jgi:hypothetical protein
MRVIKHNGNTFKRQYGVIHYSLKDITNEKIDCLQFCDSLSEAENLVYRISIKTPNLKTEIVKLEI